MLLDSSARPFRSGMHEIGGKVDIAVVLHHGHVHRHLSLTLRLDTALSPFFPCPTHRMRASNRSSTRRTDWPR